VSVSEFDSSPKRRGPANAIVELAVEYAATDVETIG
jgi:hypothetical protein